MLDPGECLPDVAAGGVRGELIARGREFLAAVKPMVAGAYLMPPFNKFEMAIDLLK